MKRKVKYGLSSPRFNNIQLEEKVNKHFPRISMHGDLTIFYKRMI